MSVICLGYYCVPIITVTLLTVLLFKSKITRPTPLISMHRSRFSRAHLLLSILYLLSNTVPLASPLLLTQSSLAMSTSPFPPSSSKLLTICLTRESLHRDASLLNLVTKDLSTLPPSYHHSIVSLPCISHSYTDVHALIATSSLNKLHTLADLINDTTLYDYVLVTSPEAAKTILRVSESASAYSPRRANFVAVGDATRLVLEEGLVKVEFTPSVANGDTLAKELPWTCLSSSSPVCRVLYPSSAKAGSQLEDGLSKRSRRFVVDKVAAYDTTTAVWESTSSNLSLAKSVDVVCFGSPSAVKGWFNNLSDNDDSHKNKIHRPRAACIGSTTQKACLEYGWEEGQVFYPEAPGMVGWVGAVREAVEMVIEARSKYRVDTGE